MIQYRKEDVETYTEISVKEPNGNVIKYTPVINGYFPQIRYSTDRDGTKVRRYYYNAKIRHSDDDALEYTIITNNKNKLVTNLKDYKGYWAVPAEKPNQEKIPVPDDRVTPEEPQLKLPVPNNDDSEAEMFQDID